MEFLVEFIATKSVLQIAAGLFLLGVVIAASLYLVKRFIKAWKNHRKSEIKRRNDGDREVP